MRRGMFVALAVALLVAGSSAGASARCAGGQPRGPRPSSAGPAVGAVQANGSVRDRSALLRGRPSTAARAAHHGHGGDADREGVLARRGRRRRLLLRRRALLRLHGREAPERADRRHRVLEIRRRVLAGGSRRRDLHLRRPPRSSGRSGTVHLDQPIVGISALKSGAGYRLVARDGGVFTFGEAVFWGSLGGRGITDVVGMATTPTGNGYWVLRKSGGTDAPATSSGTATMSPTSSYVRGPSVYNFGDAQELPVGFGEDGDITGIRTYPGVRHRLHRQSRRRDRGQPSRGRATASFAQRGTFGFAGRPPGSSSSSRTMRRRTGAGMISGAAHAGSERMCKRRAGAGSRIACRRGVAAAATFGGAATGAGTLAVDGPATRPASRVGERQRLRGRQPPVATPGATTAVDGHAEPGRAWLVASRRCRLRASRPTARAPTR